MDFFDTFEWEAKGSYPPYAVGWGGAYNTWQYRRPITINNTSGGILTDYQVLVELTPANHTYTHSEADGADLRFTRDDGTTILDYWIEEWVEDGTSKIWVKIDSIPIGNNLCAYIYCGEPGASGAGNGNSTFLFFDDFSGGSINWTSKWESIEQSSYALDGDTLKCTKVSATTKLLNSQSSFSNCVVEASIKYSHPTGFLYWAFEDGVASFDAKDYGKLDWNNNRYGIEIGDNSSLKSCTESLTLFYRIKYFLPSVGDASMKIYKEGILVHSHSAAPGYRTVHLGFFSWQQNYGYIDSVFIRKYASTDPTNTIGAEEEHIGESPLVTALTTPIEWEAKGAFETPSFTFYDLIEWDAKGGIVTTTKGEYKSTIEWTAKGSFKTPKAFVFIDLR